MKNKNILISFTDLRNSEKQLVTKKRIVGADKTAKESLQLNASIGKIP